MLGSGGIKYLNYNSWLLLYLQGIFVAFLVNKKSFERCRPIIAVQFHCYITKKNVSKKSLK